MTGLENKINKKSETISQEKQAGNRRGGTTIYIVG